MLCRINLVTKILNYIEWKSDDVKETTCMKLWNYSDNLKGHDEKIVLTKNQHLIAIIGTFMSQWLMEILGVLVLVRNILNQDKITRICLETVEQKVPISRLKITIKMLIFGK